MVYVYSCVRENVPTYFKLTGIDMQNLAVAGIIVVHIVIVI